MRTPLLCFVGLFVASLLLATPVKAAHVTNFSIAGTATAGTTQYAVATINVAPDFAGESWVNGCFCGITSVWITLTAASPYASSICAAPSPTSVCTDYFDPNLGSTGYYIPQGATSVQIYLNADPSVVLTAISATITAVAVNSNYRQDPNDPNSPYLHDGGTNAGLTVQPGTPPSFTLTVGPSQLDLSTGDGNRSVTTTSNPNTLTFTPTFSIGSQANPNSDCDATLSFSASSGTGTANTVVTASPVGCSRIASGVRAQVGATTSGNTTKIVVPPQVMIKTVVGEAGGQPGDVDQQSLLAVGRNRFGDRDFPGGRTATWQAVLIPGQFYGASDPTDNGPDQELRNSALVFTGTVGDIIGGAKCYWSPTNAQWAAIQVALNSGTIVEPTGVGIPDCWTGKPRQIVQKLSVGTNISHGSNFDQAPAFIFLRTRTKNAPAVVQIP